MEVRGPSGQTRGREGSELRCRGVVGTELPEGTESFGDGVGSGPGQSLRAQPLCTYCTQAGRDTQEGRGQFTRDSDEEGRTGRPHCLPGLSLECPGEDGRVWRGAEGWGWDLEEEGLRVCGTPSRYLNPVRRVQIGDVVLSVFPPPPSRVTQGSVPVAE